MGCARSGHEVAQRLRADPLASNLMLIALTGWHQEQDRQTASDAGFDHYLPEPIDYERLLTLLKIEACPAKPELRLLATHACHIA